MKRMSIVAAVFALAVVCGCNSIAPSIDPCEAGCYPDYENCPKHCPLS
jgi:hypothetical protein